MMTGSTLRRLCAALLAFAALAMVNGASAQDKGALDPKPLPPLANPSSPGTPARELFGRAHAAAPLHPDPIGFYSRGCLAGGEPLPINGPHWQVMRLSRNRNWGHPNLIAFLKHFSSKGARESGWPGLLIGDLSQPRGGPMLRPRVPSDQMTPTSAHAMPNRELTRGAKADVDGRGARRSA
jgi:penicillin-insensitive murein endopeptidase